MKHDAKHFVHVSDFIQPSQQPVTNKMLLYPVGKIVLLPSFQHGWPGAVTFQKCVFR